MYYNSLAMLLDNKEKFKLAIVYYTKSIEIDPYFSRSLLGRGKSRYRLGDVEGAIEDMVTVQQQDNKYSKAAQERARQFMEASAQSKNKKKEINQHAEINLDQNVQTADLKKNMENNQSETKSEKNIGQDLNSCEGFYFRKMKDEAIKCYSNILVNAPENAAAFNMLGKIAENIEYDFVTASNYYGISVKKDPNNDKYIMNFGRSLYMQRQFEQAITVFTKLIQSNSVNGDAYYFRGQCFDGIGQQEKAIQDMQLAAMYGPKIQEARQYVESHTAGLLRLLEKCELAIQDDTRALTIKPENGYVYADRAFCYVKLGDLKKAEDDFLAAAKYTGNKDHYYNEWAQVSIKTGTQLEPDGKNYQLFVARVIAYKGNNQYDMAKNDFIKAIELEPSSATSYYELGILFSERLKNYEAALINLTKAIERDKGKRNYYFERGQVYYQQNDYVNAKKDFSNVIELSPNDGQALFYRGNCNKNLGIKDQAIDDLLKSKQYNPSFNLLANQKLEEML